MIDDDIGLPKSTMNKVIKGRLPENMRIANDASQTIIKCCDEFVRIISTTANELSDKEKKSTILPEHILKATEELGFSSFLEPMNAAFEEFKEERKVALQAGKEKKAARKNNAMSEEELIALQQKLLDEAISQTMLVEGGASAFVPPVINNNNNNNSDEVVPPSLPPPPQ